MDTQGEEPKPTVRITGAQFLKIREIAREVRKNIDGILQGVEITLPSGIMICHSTNDVISIECNTDEGKEIILHMSRSEPLVLDIDLLGVDMMKGMSLLEETRDLLSGKAEEKIKDDTPEKSQITSTDKESGEKKVPIAWSLNDVADSKTLYSSLAVFSQWKDRFLVIASNQVVQLDDGKYKVIGSISGSVLEHRKYEGKYRYVVTHGLIFPLGESTIENLQKRGIVYDKSILEKECEGDECIRIMDDSSNVLRRMKVLGVKDFSDDVTRMAKELLESYAYHHIQPGIISLGRKDYENKSYSTVIDNVSICFTTKREGTVEVKCNASVVIAMQSEEHRMEIVTSSTIEKHSLVKGSEKIQVSTNFGTHKVITSRMFTALRKLKKEYNPY